MNQEPNVVQGDRTPRPTEARLKPSTARLQGRPAVVDPTQIAGAAAYGILLYLGILHGVGLLPGTADMAPRLQSAIALVGSLLLTGLVFGVMAVLRDRLARRPAGTMPEQVLRLDDALRWLVPADLMLSYAGPMTMFRLNLLDLLAAADNAQQRVPAAAYAAWPAPLDHLAAATLTTYYGVPNADVGPFTSRDAAELGRYLAERHQD
ncbi:MAG: hypothetical protein NTX94_00640 [Caldiserica bacterium]|nr:hypothetical protein [Caldisericota bacterium]